MNREEATALLNEMVDEQLLEAKDEVERVVEKAVDEKLAQAKDEIMETVDRTLGEKILSGREAILSVLERAASDTMFVAELSDDPEHALRGYGLTSEEKAAVSSGDIRRIESWIGDLEPKHKKWLWARLQQEKW